MAAPDELFCWEGDWGLPSVDTDCLVVLAYAKFAGAPLKLQKLSNPWRSPSGSLPVLRTSHKETLSRPSDIIIHLRKQCMCAPITALLQTADEVNTLYSWNTLLSMLHSVVEVTAITAAYEAFRNMDFCSYLAGNLVFFFQKFNADFDLSAKEGADSLAFISLVEEKLRPALIYTFWVEPKNYVDVTRCWYAEHLPFPLNFFLPGQMQRHQLNKLCLQRGDESLEVGDELEKELYRDAAECMNLLSQRLGSHKFFFGDSPSSLDAYVFGHLAPILRCKLPNMKLQQHLKSLDNLSNFCSNVLLLYFPRDGRESCAQKTPSPPDGADFEHVPNKRRKQLLSALVALGAMLSYALLTGMVSIQQVQQEELQAIGPEEEEGDG
ncbi:Metaxin-1 Mitochondrial outer membrane import complex protein 1 [Takifugu flavidus]|uniref:Metaxin n=1 Tax=Takifugu flavidus TaxID=433684 RepID=A0A5C6PJ34_9TELE|nr:Metaxin-1 Mitochondrial outer membrane import complex protein 1 [Takifugu flavidus]